MSTILTSLTLIVALASPVSAQTRDDLPPLNKKVLQFAVDNIGKSVGDGECATLVTEAYRQAKARMLTKEEALARVFGRRLGEKEKALPGDIVEFKDIRLEGKDGGLETLFHTTVLYKVKEDGKFVLLHQSKGVAIAELDMSMFEMKKGELIVYRPVPPGTALPKVVLPSAAGTWMEKLPGNQRFRYLSDLKEFEVKVADNRFGKKGNLGFGAGDSFEIRVEKKASPNGISMSPEANGQSSVKYRLALMGKTFFAKVALNDSAGAPGKPPGEGAIPTGLVFVVLGDGKVLWKSKPVDTAKMVQDCKADLSGVNVLEIRVECPGTNVNAQPVWLEPRVLLK